MSQLKNSTDWALRKNLDYGGEALELRVKSWIDWALGKNLDYSGEAQELRVKSWTDWASGARAMKKDCAAPARSQQNKLQLLILIGK